jgi:esterase/lipase superfamily enzyme
MRILVLLLASVIGWLLASGAEAQAGPADSALNWLLGLVLGAFAGAAGTYHAVQRANAIAPHDKSPLDVQLPNLIPETVNIYKVWFATNRQLKGDEFTPDLDENLQFGDCQVAIPQSHEFGSLGSPSYVRLLQRVTTGSDDLLRIVKRSVWTLEEGPEGFLKSIHAALDAEANQILVYVHGYNVSFENAIVRAAQIGFDLKVQGITAAFCWASMAQAYAYMADEERVQLSGKHLADFLAMLNTNFPDSTINIIAHSMGNRALMEVLENIHNHSALTAAKFGQIILAAPDINEQSFRRVAVLYPQLSMRTTLYVCARDRALEASGRGHSNVRIGYCPPVTVAPGIDTIEVTNVSLDLLGHGYYASAASVLHDMFLLLRNNVPPAERPSLLSSNCADGASYWKLSTVAG